MLIAWILVFVGSLALLVKGADLMLDSSERIGIAIGLSPFIVGVIIVGLGTSFPELISSLVATSRGVTEIVVSNAVGSNIANILLVVGLSALVGRQLTVTKSLIDIDLPLLAATTALFLGVAWDGLISAPEALFLVAAYIIYLAYTVVFEQPEPDGFDMPDVLPSRRERRHGKKGKIVLNPKDFIFLATGVVGLIVGAHFLIDAVIAISAMLGIATGTITLAAVALGTSLPEVSVSVRAAWKNESEVALGNIFGSNVFNILVVVGLPGLMRDLTIDPLTLSLGLPVLIVATALFIISGISRRIYMWEGSLYVLIYLLFIGKLFGIL